MDSRRNSPAKVNQGRKVTVALPYSLQGLHHSRRVVSQENLDRSSQGLRPRPFPRHQHRSQLTFQNRILNHRLTFVTQRGTSNRITKLVKQVQLFMNHQISRQVSGCHWEIAFVSWIAITFSFSFFGRIKRGAGFLYHSTQVGSTSKASFGEQSFPIPGNCASIRVLTERCTLIPSRF